MAQALNSYMESNPTIMKKNNSAGILIESESLKKAGTSRESTADNSISKPAHGKPVGKDLLKKGKKL